ncbi:MAG: hypothetical protein HRF49_10950 [bacterium]|jgi:hypothetical protein
MSVYKTEDRGGKFDYPVELKGVSIVEKARRAEPGEIGLCVTCSHHETCLFAKAARQPVWFCDEFTSFEQSNAQTHAGNAADAGVDPEAAATGLCANCESFEGCAYRAKGVPVLECEEYK